MHHHQDRILASVSPSSSWAYLLLPWTIWWTHILKFLEYMMVVRLSSSNIVEEEVAHRHAHVAWRTSQMNFMGLACPWEATCLSLAQRSSSMLHGEATECLREEPSDSASDVDERVLLFLVKKLTPLLNILAAQTYKPTHRGFLAGGRTKYGRG